MERGLSNRAAGAIFFQKFNIGDVIDLNRFISHFNDSCF